MTPSADHRKEAHMPGEVLTETLAEVTALIPRYAWEIMDEEQRDDLMGKVVLPRYMKTTADGTKLGPTVWANMVGASEPAIRNRVQRLQQKQKLAAGGRSPVDTKWEKDKRRAAIQTIRELPPEQVEHILTTTRPEIVDRIRQEAVEHEQQAQAAGRAIDRSKKPTHRSPEDAMLEHARAAGWEMREVARIWHQTGGELPEIVRAAIDIAISRGQMMTGEAITDDDLQAWLEETPR